MSLATKVFKLAAPAVIGAAMLAAPATGQSVQGAGSDAFNLPDDVTFISTSGNPNLRRATARVNGNVITGTDIEHRLALVMASQDGVQYAPEQMQELRLQVLRNLIDETLQVQEAAALDMAVEQERVDSAYADFATRARGMTVPELDAYLASIGSSPRSIKQQIRGELAWERLLQRNIYPFVNISEEEVREVHRRIVEATGTTEYRLGEIFLSSNPTNREQVMANATQIVNQLRQGGSFVAYARQFSEASTRVVGGDLGWIRLEQLQQPVLEAAARQMTAGQLVGPLEIPGGVSILLMIDQRQIGMPDPRDAVLSLKQISIGFEPGTTPEQAEARAAAFVEAVGGMAGCGDANARAAAIGAQVVDNDEIPVRQLPEALQVPLLQLNIGQTTPPFGDLQEGVRVLMLCGRDDPQQATQLSEDDIEDQILNDRVNRRAQRYLRDLRRDAVIEYN